MRRDALFDSPGNNNNCYTAALAMSGAIPLKRRIFRFRRHGLQTRRHELSEREQQLIFTDRPEPSEPVHLNQMTITAIGAEWPHSNLWKRGRFCHPRNCGTLCRSSKPRRRRRADEGFPVLRQP
jgi:hypothetical protein